MKSHFQKSEVYLSKVSRNLPMDQRPRESLRYHWLRISLNLKLNLLLKILKRDPQKPLETHDKPQIESKASEEDIFRCNIQQISRCGSLIADRQQQNFDFPNTKVTQNWGKHEKPLELPMEQIILHVHLVLDSAILPSSKLFSTAVWFWVLNHQSVVKTRTQMQWVAFQIQSRKTHNEKESHANFHTCLLVPVLHARLTGLAWPPWPTALWRVKMGVGVDLDCSDPAAPVGELETTQNWASALSFHSSFSSEGRDTHHMASAPLGCTPLFQINDS